VIANAKIIMNNFIALTGHKRSRVHRQQRAQLNQHGFVLIEVLVAGLIFAVGVLGLVGLQAQMTRSQTNSKHRADAVNLAQELIGSMWSDYMAVRSFDTLSNRCANNPMCAGWQAKAARELPSAVTSVDVQPGVSANSKTVTVVLKWESQDGPQTYSTQTEVGR
jgi:type IV pilus assembly protein PilV